VHSTQSLSPTPIIVVQLGDMDELSYRSAGLHAASQQLAATITPAQMRDVRLMTPCYDIGIASLE
jgi:hypothetical protein